MLRCCRVNFASAFRPVTLTEFIQVHAARKGSTELAYRRVAVKTNSDSIYENLAAEEALLRGVVLGKDQGMLMLYVNDPCVVVGRNQNVLQEVSLRRAARDGVKVARRSSGGGAVYHDQGNLCLSFFTSRADYAPEKTIQILRAALSAGFGMDPQRLTSTKRHDLFLDGKKITGSAMRVQRDIAFHHCTLLLSSSRAGLGKYLSPEIETAFFHTAAVSSVRSPVTTLQEEVETKDPSGSLLLQVPVFAEFMAYFYEQFGGMASGDLLADKATDRFLRKWQQSRSCVEQDVVIESKLSSNSLFEIDVKEAMRSFRFIDGDGRPISKDVTMLAAEVDRCRSLDWLWNMPKFESVVLITEEELRCALLFRTANGSSESTSAALWKMCLSNADGGARDQDFMDEIMDCLFRGQQNEFQDGVLFLRSVVLHRKLIESRLFFGSKSAGCSTTTRDTKGNAVTLFDASRLQEVEPLSLVLEALLKNQCVSTLYSSSELLAALQGVISSQNFCFDVPEQCQDPCTGLVIDALLRVWRRKNSFDFEVAEEGYTK